MSCNGSSVHRDHEAYTHHQTQGAAPAPPSAVTPVPLAAMLQISGCSGRLLNATACQETWLLDTGYASIRYSSIHNNDPVGVNYGTGKLDSEQGWSSIALDLNQWMEIDIGQTMNVAGVVTQGRRASNYMGISGVAAQWVTAYRVEVSVDGTAWTGVDNGRVFEGNNDNDSKVRRLFDQRVLARYVRFRPTAWTGYITMRAAVLLCSFNCTVSPCLAWIHVWYACMCLSLRTSVCSGVLKTAAADSRCMPRWVACPLCRGCILAIVSHDGVICQAPWHHHCL
jgi:hypothetical protein